MDVIDEFQSVFRRAERPHFRYDRPSLRSVLLVTDRNRADAARIRDLATAYCGTLSTCRWEFVVDEDYRKAAELLEIVRSARPDLVVTYRYLDEHGLIPHHALGVYVELLAQCSPAPVLLLPASGRTDFPVPSELPQCREVIVVTDYLTGDDRLVNYGAALAPDDGKLVLSHIEDSVTFRRYMRAVERIPDVPTEPLRQQLSQQLLHDAERYADSAAEALRGARPGLRVESVVRFGRSLRHYAELIAEYTADLVVFNTQAEDQHAMSGLSYSMATEFSHVPLLLVTPPVED
ncbi:MAG: hypothetical protein D6725_09980 [Planctomycetota bacterium]|nr:MAG: hypothetical protein D6725_09980 [Planctomycetota bacterium]